MGERYAQNILTIALALITLFIGAYIERNGFNSNSIILVVVGAILLTLIIIFWDWINKIFLKIGLSLKEINTDFIFESFKTSLEYLDLNGQMVSYHREDHISKLSLRRSKRQMEFPIYVSSGRIIRDQTSTIKSSVSFVSDNEAKFKVYFNSRDVFKKQHYSSYSTVFEGSFTSDEESWVISTNNFCKFFQLLLIFPKKFGEVSATVHRRGKISGSKKKKDKTWKETGIPVMKTTRYGKKVLRVVIIGFSNNDQYKVEWSKTK